MLFSILHHDLDSPTEEKFYQDNITPICPKHLEMSIADMRWYARDLYRKFRSYWIFDDYGLVGWFGVSVSVYKEESDHIHGPILTTKYIIDIRNKDLWKSVLEKVSDSITIILPYTQPDLQPYLETVGFSYKSDQPEGSLYTLRRH